MKKCHFKRVFTSDHFLKDVLTLQIFFYIHQILYSKFNYENVTFVVKF